MREEKYRDRFAPQIGPDGVRAAPGPVISGPVAPDIPAVWDGWDAPPVQTLPAWDGWDTPAERTSAAQAAPYIRRAPVRGTEAVSAAGTGSDGPSAAYQTYHDRARDASAGMQANAIAAGTMNPALTDGGYGVEWLADKLWQLRERTDAYTQAEAAGRAARINETAALQQSMGLPVGDGGQAAEMAVAFGRAGRWYEKREAAAQVLEERMKATRDRAEIAFADGTGQYTQDEKDRAYLDLVRDVSTGMQANTMAMGAMNPALLDSGQAAMWLGKKVQQEERARMASEAQAAENRAAAMRKAEQAFDETGQYNNSLSADEQLLAVRSFLADDKNAEVYIRLQNARDQGEMSVQALMDSGQYTPAELERAALYLDLNDSIPLQDQIMSGARSAGHAVAGGLGRTAGGLMAASESLYGGANAQYLLEQDDFMRGFSNVSPKIGEMTGANPVGKNGVAAQMLDWSEQEQQLALRNLPEGTAGRWLGEAGVNAAQDVIARAPEVLMPGFGTAASSIAEAGTRAYELEKQGVDADEALLHGVVNSGISATAKLLPIEQWVKILGTPAGENFLQETVRQILGESTKDMVGDFLNQLADTYFDDPNSRASLWDLVKSFAERYRPMQTLQTGAQSLAGAGIQDAFTAG